MNMPCGSEYGRIIETSEMSISVLHDVKENVIRKMQAEILRAEIQKDKYYNGEQVYNDIKRKGKVR